MSNFSTEATIHENNPTFYKDNMQGTQFTLTSAMIDITDIPLTTITGSQVVEVKAKSATKNGIAIAPINEKITYGFLISYGFCFPILKMSPIKDGGIYNIELICNPDEFVFNIVLQPVTAKYEEKGIFRLDDDYTQIFLNPAAYRMKKVDDRVIKLVHTDNPRKLKCADPDKDKLLDENEEVKIIGNWNP